MEFEAATWALFALSAVLVGVGLAGMMLPVIPGAPVLLAGLVIAAWAEDFAYVGYGTLTVLGLLVLLTYAVDLAAGAFGARRFGATRRGMLPTPKRRLGRDPLRKLSALPGSSRGPAGPPDASTPWPSPGKG